MNTTRILVYRNGFKCVAIGPKTVAIELQQRFTNRLICSRYCSSIVTVNVTVPEKRCYKYLYCNGYPSIYRDYNTTSIVTVNNHCIRGCGNS
ncbi:hypothetical protein H5410_020338 [Solanum commersonii]|uniref:Uncharacterized protein n=1 Tax=Solanum commersonii TaxID=4109 RepID=A0A9J5Z858_SOLCO|nr:hypothetical protein H5410_020338 [Solanum commersonii]